jgi:hypothetical protein
MMIRGMLVTVIWWPNPVVITMRSWIGIRPMTRPGSQEHLRLPLTLTVGPPRITHPKFGPEVLKIRYRNPVFQATGIPKAAIGP